MKKKEKKQNPTCVKKEIKVKLNESIFNLVQDDQNFPNSLLTAGMGHPRIFKNY